jgi:hypothetical protein
VGKKPTIGLLDFPNQYLTIQQKPTVNLEILEDDSVNPELDFSGLDRNGSFGTLGHWRNPQAPRRKVQFVG